MPPHGPVGDPPLVITYQITDHYALYCDELRYGATNDISMLAD